MKACVSTCASEDATIHKAGQDICKDSQGTQVNQARQISVVINNAFSGEFVAEFSLSSTATVQTVKEHLSEQGHPRLQSLVLSTEPLDENTSLEELLLVTGDRTLTLQMLRMAKRRAQLARACGRSSLGWVLFQGPVLGQGHESGEWLGLEMDDPFGDCDGTCNGISYFPCKPNCGLFVQPDDVRFIDDEAELQEDERVMVASRLGRVCFRGSTTFADGEWVGIELDEAVGKNDGCVRGIRYFWGATSHGIFVRPSNLRTVEERLGDPHSDTSY